MSFIRTTATLDKLAKGVDARFLDVFVENADAYQSNLAELFQTRSSDKKREHTKLIGGTGYLQRKTEGDSVSRTDLKLSYETEFIHDTYSKGVTVTMEDVQDRDWEEKLSEFGHLSRSARITMDRAKAQVFNGGFATTTTVNGLKISLLNDGKPLFSTVHPLIGGGTASNASSTGAPLSDTTLEDAIIALKRQVADDGTALALTGKLALIVPPALRKLAQQLAGSELKPDTANNAVNVYRGAIDVYECVWLDASHGGSNTAWFVMAPSQAKLMFMERLAPTYDMTIDGNTKNRSHDVLARWSVGHADWRFTWGSKGDNVAYSS